VTIEELTFEAFKQGREQGREESAAQIKRLRFALIQMTPDYEDMISDAVDHGADETWVEECRQIAAYARAALQPKEQHP
jgi:hypothetical protein